MRIIAGQQKGRTLQGPTGAGVRPTSDRLRETVFNVVRDDVPAATVLDAFAGTGAMGLEALSRGAAHVVFIERDPHAVAVIRRNVATCRAENACAIIRDDFIGVAGRHHQLGPCTLALLDPPYDFPDLDAAVREARRLLSVGGMLVLEHSRRRVPPESVPGLQSRRRIVAGDSAVTLYEAVKDASMGETETVHV